MFQPPLAPVQQQAPPVFQAAMPLDIEPNDALSMDDVLTALNCEYHDLASGNSPLFGLLSVIKSAVVLEHPRQQRSVFHAPYRG